MGWGGVGLTKGDEGKVGGGVDSSGGGRVWKGLLGLRWGERWKIEGVKVEVKVKVKVKVKAKVKVKVKLKVKLKLKLKRRGIDRRATNRHEKEM